MPDSVLVIVSNDYGELGLANNFIRGLKNQFDIHILLPSHLYKVNHDVLDFHCIAYQGDDNVVEVENELQPKFVLFFSAYLLVTDQIFTHRTLKVFVDRLEERGAILMTSDPFLGISATLKITDLKSHMFPVNANHGVLQRFIFSIIAIIQLKRINDLLSRTPTIAPFYDDVAAEADDHYCFFDPGPPLPASESAGDKTVIGEPDWVFVISQLDYEIQHARLGEDRFADLLSKRLAEVEALGKNPVLVAPERIKDPVQKRTSCEFKFFYQSDLSSFEQLVINAERVFYWNMISYSLYNRFVHFKPIHFFDRGHLSRMIPRLHEKAMQSYFQGKEPVELNFEVQLREDELVMENAKFYEFHRQRLDEVHGYSAPAAVMHKLEDLNRRSIP